MLVSRRELDGPRVQVGALPEPLSRADLEQFFHASRALPCARLLRLPGGEALATTARQKDLLGLLDSLCLQVPELLATASGLDDLYHGPVGEGGDLGFTQFVLHGEDLTFAFLRDPQANRGIAAIFSAGASLGQVLAELSHALHSRVVE